MSQSSITKEAILLVMRNSRHRSRRLWTASVIIDRMGLYRRFSNHTGYSKRARLRVRRLLRELHREGVLVVVKERHTLHSATWTPEVAYGLADPDGDDRHSEPVATQAPDRGGQAP